jgi:hypothetical protein
VLDRNGGPLYTWPPLTATMAYFNPPHGGWDAIAEERERRAREDTDRMKGFYQDRQREREEREKAEIEAAKERDRQAYRERGWPA